MSSPAQDKKSSSSAHRPATPRRYIYDDVDLRHFLASPAKHELVRLVAAQGKACTTSSFCYDPKTPLLGISPALACLHGALEVLLEWVSEYPPVKSSQIRFGNPAFKDWHRRLTERSGLIVSTILRLTSKYPGADDYDVTVLEAAAELGRQAARAEESIATDEGTATEIDPDIVTELQCYLHDAFGHPIRLDYGTGHECSFEVFLFVLCKLHCFGSTAEQPPSLDRLKATTLSIYHQYLKVTRKLQTDYMLEPAGSHGVWGLDDYHCLPFYFGACQLQQETLEEEFKPSSIHDESTLRSQSDTFIFFGCIRFIKELKKGVPFYESSPMLNDISQLSSWTKVASGLIKLFEGEVLKKRQVVQHFRFGKIFAANWTPSQSHPQEAPTEPFRVPTSALSAMSPTKAPWAT